MQIFVKHQIYKTMKKLQNNFTTPEQSKRLLELGVPADSADMYYHKEIGFTSFYSEPEVIPSCELFSTGNPVYIHDIPCWSVGRLIEIMKICNHPDDVEQVFCELEYSKKNFVELIVRLMEENKERTDFSILEE
jgi:hypothetical protein